MKNCSKIISVIISLLLLCFVLNAQIDTSNICHIENGKIAIKFDNRWPNNIKKELELKFNIDTILLNFELKENKEVIIDNVTWSINKINDNIIELSKQLNTNFSFFNEFDNIYLIEDRKKNTKPSLAEEWINYGVNSFSDFSVFEYSDGFAKFVLKNYINAKSIYLSGTFNSWSTMQTPMQRVDSCWVATVRLNPGKYKYKYIVNGKWITDPQNNLKEKDTYKGYNSVVYCYNYCFSLKGYNEAHKVYVAGSFNNWNNKELKMNRISEGWILPLFLREGTHAYKFIIDKDWITDPANPVIRPDGEGNYNSFIGIGDSYTFHLKGFQNAKKVILSGNFNAWNSEELQMEKSEDGWILPYVLAAGNYEYKFIVDGNWITDPENPYTTGTGEYTNSFLPFKENFTFTYNKNLHAKKVILTGSFNNWDTENYKMNKNNENWSISLYLRPGKYTYKLIVDGEWIIDPENKLWEENEYGTGNSVLWIEP